jgi:hypothetical protein
MMYNNKKTEKMKTEKKTYEKPTVQKVEFDFKTRIAGSGSTCYWPSDMVGAGDDECMN